MPREGGIYFIPTLKSFFSTLLKVKWISQILQKLGSKYIEQKARICSWREILRTTLSMEKNLQTTRWKKTSHAINKKKAGKDYPKAPGLPGPGQEKLIRYPVFSYPLLSGLTGHNYLHINTDGRGWSLDKQSSKAHFFLENITWKENKMFNF